MSDHDGYGDRPWRRGRSVGRTIYDSNDRLIGVMDTPLLAALVVLGVNQLNKAACDHDWTRWDTFGDYGWSCRLCGRTVDEDPAPAVRVSPKPHDESEQT